MSGRPRVLLRGITWDHPRGLAPLQATATAFRAIDPAVEVSWEARSGELFVDAPLRQLVENYDLVVFDHPSIGEAVSQELLVPLEQHLAVDFLNDQTAHSVGLSHASYQADGSQWALAIDAAALVSARSAAIVADGVPAPSTWDEALMLMRDLRSQGRRTAITTTGVDLLMHLLALVAQQGVAAGETDVFIPIDEGVVAIELLREIVALTDEQGRLMDHPDILDGISAGQFDYSPSVFGYSLYSDTSRNHPVHFSDLPARAGRPRSVLGGAGLGVSRRTPQLHAAVAYASFVASAEVQRTTYAFSGGQPGHGIAWDDEAVNAAYGQFYTSTRSSLSGAVLRPRFDGWLRQQRDLAGIINQIGLSSPRALLDAINARHRLDLPVTPQFRGRMAV